MPTLADLLADPRITTRTRKIIGDREEVLRAHDRMRQRYAAQMDAERAQLEQAAVRHVLVELAFDAKPAAPIPKKTITLAEYEADKQAAWDFAATGQLTVLRPDGSLFLDMAGRVEPLTD